MNWRTPITLVVLLGVLLGAAYYGWNTIVNPGDNTNASAPKEPKNQPCKKKTTIKKGSRIQAVDVRVNVYNAGTRTGLAGDTLESLVSKGFKRGVADNVPDDINATWGNVSIVLPGGKVLPQVRLVRNQFIGVVKFIKGTDAGGNIDVVVGDNFRGVKGTSATSVRVNRAVKTCV